MAGKTLIFLISCFFILSCQQKTTESNDSELVAQVYDHKLYESDLENIFAGDTENSTTKNAYVEKWIREKLITTEAEKKVSKSLKIEKLVEDYKTNLLRLEYERMILDEKMEESISKEEYEETYNRDKMIYALKGSIVKASFIEIPKSSPNIAQVRKLWRADNWGRLKSTCTNKTIYSYFGDQDWIELSELKTRLPSEIVLSRKLKENLKFEASHGENEYFLKIWDIIDKNAEPPLEYISDQLSKVILHRRRKAILNQMTEELYEIEIRKNNIKVFTKASE